MHKIVIALFLNFHSHKYLITFFLFLLGVKASLKKKVLQRKQIIQTRKSLTDKRALTPAL